MDDIIKAQPSKRPAYVLVFKRITVRHSWRSSLHSQLISKRIISRKTEDANSHLQPRLKLTLSCEKYQLAIEERAGYCELSSPCILSCISKRPPLREAQPGIPGKTSLALMTSLAQKLTMLLLGHACTTLLDDRSHDGPPIDRSLQLRVNRIVSYNFFPTLGRTRTSQSDNLKNFSRLSASHHSGNCW